MVDIWELLTPMVFFIIEPLRTFICHLHCDSPEGNVVSIVCLCDHFFFHQEGEGLGRKIVQVLSCTERGKIARNLL